MRITGIDTKAIRNASVSLGSGTASLTMSVDAKAVKNMINKHVYVQLDYTTGFDAIVTNITDYGYGTGIATVNCPSLIDIAFTLPYKDSTPAHTNAVTGASTIEAYKGNRWDSIDYTTAEVTRIGVDNIIRRCISATNDDITELYGYPISVSFFGAKIPDKKEVLSWNGETIGDIILSITDALRNVSVRVNGRTLEINKFDDRHIDRYISTKDISEPQLSLDLQNITTELIIESPDLGIHDVTQELSTSNVAIGLDALVDNRYVNASCEPVNETTVDLAVFDDTFHLLRYEVDSTDDNYIQYGYDVRQIKTGQKSYNKYGWKKKQVIIDEDLGKSSANTVYDFSDIQQTVANNTAKELAEEWYVGSFKVPVLYQIGIGDVCQLWNLGKAIVLGISADSRSRWKTINVGVASGSPYETIKERAKIAGGYYEVIQSEKDREKIRERALKTDNGAKRQVSFLADLGRFTKTTHVRSWFKGVFGGNSNRKGNAGGTQKHGAPTQATIKKEERANRPPKTYSDAHKKTVQDYNKKVHDRGGTNYIREDWMRR